MSEYEHRSECQWDAHSTPNTPTSLKQALVWVFLFHTEQREAAKWPDEYLESRKVV